jgi:SSS family solute:Na+ symporter
MIFLLALVVLVVVSLRAPETLTATRAAVMWQASSWRQDQNRLGKLPIWRDYRYQGAALLGLTVLIVLAFR